MSIGGWGLSFLSVRLSKKWLSIDEARGLLRGNLGVFALADAQQSTRYIGYAGGKSSFGLKGEVAAAVQALPAVTFVRWEVTTSYLSRYKELLMLHHYDYGELPPDNPPPAAITLGKLRPAG